MAIQVSDVPADVREYSMPDGLHQPSIVDGALLPSPHVLISIGTKGCRAFMAAV